MPMAAPTHANTQRAKRRRNADAQRGNASQRGYGARWRKARASYLARNPLCRRCWAEGRAVGATEVDHIVPFNGDERLQWDQDNWQPLCHRCHSQKTAAETGGWDKAR